MINYSILREPFLSEKGLKIKETENKVIFKVSMNANKQEIKKAVESVFKVTVLKVNTVICHGKEKRHTNGIKGRRPDWKKAIITLKKDDKIEYFEGT